MEEVISVTNPYLELDQLADEFEEAWKTGKRPKVSTFLDRVALSQRLQLAEFLIPVDLDYRQQGGESVDPQKEYGSLGSEFLAIALRCLEQNQTQFFAGPATALDDQDLNSQLITNDQIGDFLDVDRELDQTATPDDENLRLSGRYTLVQKLGEGGMGTVWLAEQSSPVKRRVAIKMIKIGMDSRQILSRFKAERQALAIMDHPNIAKIFDGGLTKHGRPYFVMEYVRGVPITKYCDDSRVPLKERLDLFLNVCLAVQHAHQKGIIHRDLKPSNILVSVVDGKPVPKVIDFGLAKAMYQPLSDHSVFTFHGMMLGTPLYMSPEQATENNSDIDIRSDIYSLGVILYELLVGTTPLERTQFNRAAWNEVLRMIKEVDPPSPSSRLSTSGQMASIAAQRSIEPLQLRKAITGELDWIVMKSLEKDRNRRYESAISFAKDIEFFLSNEPVSAVPPSAFYRFKKLVRKHRLAMTAAALIAMSLTVGIILAIWFALLAHRAKLEATAKATEVEEEKSKVELERDRANQNERLALEKAAESNAAQLEAQREALRAKHEEAKAVAALEKVESTMARTNYHLAVTRWESGKVREAVAYLDAIPAKHRHFEWYFDRRLFDGFEWGSEVPYLVSSLRYSPDGKRLIGSLSNGEIRVWNPRNGNLVKTIPSVGFGINQMELDSAGQILATANSDGSIAIWNLEQFKRTKTWQVNQQAMLSVGISPDGKHLVCGGLDGQVLLFDVETETLLWQSENFGRPIRSVCFGRCGTFLCYVCDDATIRVIRLPTFEERKIEQAHEAMIISHLAISPDNNLVLSSGHDHVVKIWNLQNLTPQQEFTGHGLAVLFSTFSPDGKTVVSTSGDELTFIWDAATGEAIRSLRGHTHTLTSIDFHPDEKQLATSSVDHTVRVWDADRDRLPRTWKGHDGFVRNVEFSPDGKLMATASDDGTVGVWDSTSRQPIHLLKSFEGFEAGCVCFTFDGQQLASIGQNGVIHVWSVEEGTRIQSIKVNESGLVYLKSSLNDSRLVSVDRDNQVKVWNLDNGKLLCQFSTGHFTARAVFSPCGTKIATASFDGRVGLWDAETGKPVTSIEAHPNWATALRYAIDGSTIISGSEDSSIKIWNASDGSHAGTLLGHRGKIYELACSPDGQRVLSSSFDKTVKLWDLAAQAELRSFSWHKTHVTAVAWSPDGSRVLMGDNDGDLSLTIINQNYRPIKSRVNLEH
jgi:WD40 repeat protein/serine/threonine protein kinase